MTANGRAMIFDVDGTLVDSNDAHTRAWVEALAAEGFTVDASAVRRLIGMGADKLLPALTGVEADSARGHAIVERRAARFRDVYLKTLRSFDGTRALFQALHARGVRTAIASSAEKNELDALLKIAEVADLIEEEASSSDAERSKPDPDIVRAALERLDIADIAAVSMIGDTPYDVEAARRAGLRPIAFRCGGWSAAALSNATLIFDNPADMLARLDVAL
jgi:HAD superfamily hydrolase (TIGR01549 family)